MKQSHETAEVVKVKFFTFDQNNSGGVYEQSKSRGVGKNIVIQAIDLAHALSRLEKITEGFTWSCECCGDRWSGYADKDDGSDSPEKYGEPIREYVQKDVEKGSFGFNNNVAIHYLDGKIEWFGNIPGED